MSDLAEYVQTDRSIKLLTPLGPDLLLPERIELTEMVNDLFDIKVTVRSKRPDLKPDELVGKLADVSLDLDGAGTMRAWNGLMVEMHEEPHVMRGFRQYHLVMRPQMWLMSQRSDCRIWQDQSALDVLRTLVSEHGLPPAQVAVLGTVPPQHYSVQWNETDLDYLTRRLEEDGLFFWHVHEAGKHTLRVADHQFSYTPGATPDVRLELGSSDKDCISAWTKKYTYTPGVRAGGDWNFETPGTVPRGQTPSLVKLPGNPKYELYEYPSRIGTAAEAGRATKLRMQATEYDHERIEAGGDSKTLAPGQLFKPYDVSKHGPKYEEHVVLSMTHIMEDHSFEPEDNARDYTNSFMALPSRLPATPHRDTHRPRLDGTQIGIVAGPEGEEIHTDEYGRVKLWFPWDRRAKKDGTDTCWVRVIQSWGGGGWGAQVIPRIGMEAMVTYLDGDPDRPVVAGLVPNPQQRVPYSLPAQKTRMVMRSNTYKGTGFNEFTMEDQPGAERMHMHAQHDHTIKVGNNQTERVDAHQVQSVGGSRSVEVAGNQKHEVGGSMNVTVGGTGLAAAAQALSVAGLAGHTAGLLSQALGGGGGIAMSIASSALGFLGGGGLGSREGVVAGASPKADAGAALTGSGAGVGDAVASLFGLSGVMNTVVGAHKNDTVGVSSTEQVGQAKVVNVGDTSLEQVGKYKKIAVGDLFVIECGASKLTMAADGTVTIAGTKFNFVSTGPVQVRGAPIDLN